MTIIWKDMVVERPKTYELIENGDGTYTLVPSFGTILDAGTPVNAANMNKLLDKTGDTITGTLVINNNIGLQGKNKAGTAANLCMVDNNDITVLGTNTRLSRINSNANPLIRIGSADYTIYHTGYKPTASDVKALPITGGTLTGNLNVSGDIKITKSGANFIAPNNYGYCGLNKSGVSRYLIYMNTDNHIELGYEPESPVINCRGNTIAHKNFTVNGTGTISNLVVSGGSMTINKSGYSSMLNFAKQTNDPGYIEHNENNNVAIMRFSVSDDTADTDYFAFGYTNNGFQTRFRINSNGNTTISGTLTTSGAIRTSSSLTYSNGLRATVISGSTGGINLSSGGNVNRRLFIGTDTDWNGGKPPGSVWGDIWLKP